MCVYTTTFDVDELVLWGRYETLVKHRFASHVCQTLFSVARDTVSREVCAGILCLFNQPINISDHFRRKAFSHLYPIHLTRANFEH